MNPRAPSSANESADSPCALFDKIIGALRKYRAQHQTYDEGGEHVQLVDLLTPTHDATIERGQAELELLADYIYGEIALPAPPVLSARPNEVVEEALACLREVAGSQSGSYWKWAAAIIEQWPNNEADAPRGQLELVEKEQPVACWIDGADIGHLRDGKEQAYVYPQQIIPCMVALYESHPPSVGEADGVREKYRAVTLEDAQGVYEAYWAEYAKPLLNHNEAMVAALNSIGAVVPNEVHVPQEGK